MTIFLESGFSHLSFLVSETSLRLLVIACLLLYSRYCFKIFNFKGGDCTEKNFLLPPNPTIFHTFGVVFFFFLLVFHSRTGLNLAPLRR